MHSGVRKIAGGAGWRLKAILRARSYFTTPELFRLYKANVLSYIKSGVADISTRAFQHWPAWTVYKVCFCVQSACRRTRRCSISDWHLWMRRCVAIFGFPHSVVLGRVSPQILELFPRAAARADRNSISERVRGVAQRHSKQLLDRVHARSSEQFKRSICGMVQCYNALPQDIVDEESICGFQNWL